MNRNRVGAGITQTGLHQGSTHGIPVDIWSEPLSITTVCIFGCSLVGYLAIITGPDLLVLALAIITIGFFLFWNRFTPSATWLRHFRERERRKS